MRDNYRGPLHGVPVAVKDLMYTRGVRTTAGSKILAEFVPDSDATVVARLRQAGAVLVGKTALHEFAYGITNDNPHYGPTRNPWNRERSSGGSSTCPSPTPANSPTKSCETLAGNGTKIRSALTLNQ